MIQEYFIISMVVFINSLAILVFFEKFDIDTDDSILAVFYMISGVALLFSTFAIMNFSLYFIIKAVARLF